VQCIDFVRWYPVRRDPAMVFTKYSYYVKLLLCFVPSEFLEKANIWTEVHGSIKLILTPYSMVGHIWPNLIFYFYF